MPKVVSLLFNILKTYLSIFFIFYKPCAQKSQLSLSTKVFLPYNILSKYISMFLRVDKFQKYLLNSPE